MSTLLNQIKGLNEIVNEANDDRGGLGAFNAAFGNSAEKFAQGRRPDPKTGKIEANWKDRLFGHSTDELTEEFYKKKADNILLSDDITKFLTDSKETINIKDPKGVLLSKAGNYEKAEKARSNFAAQGYIVPKTFKTEQDILIAGNRLRKDDKTSPTNLAIEQRDFSRGQAAEAKRTEQSRYLDLMEQNLANRQFQQMQAQNNFQLQMGQMGMNNRRLDMENARSNRRDQREALALILQGLTNVSNNLVNY
jgi:hypothetical protein